MDRWHARFYELASQSALIVLIADNTPSLRWEIQKLSERRGVSRLMFVMPPSRDVHWYADWTALTEQFSFLPTISLMTAAIIFDEKEHPRLIDASSPDVSDRLAAIAYEFDISDFRFTSPAPKPLVDDKEDLVDEKPWSRKAIHCSRGWHACARPKVGRAN
ncbi:MAG: hypothetical protein MJE77_22255 [Proteobacteria bacterium]|nr:hypothetical protein [Pseudomonadota bacterium]